MQKWVRDAGRRVPVDRGEDRGGGDRGIDGYVLESSGGCGEQDVGDGFWMAGRKGREYQALTRKLWGL